MQLNVQRVLEHRKMPIGSTTARKLDPRVVAASNVDLEKLVAAGRFRASPFYWLSRVKLLLPPLPERREDLGPLLRTFVLRAAARLGVEPPALTTRAFRHLERHD